MVGVPQGVIRALGTNFTSSAAALLDGAPVNSSQNNSGEIDINLDVSQMMTPKSHTVQIKNAAGSSSVLTFDVYSPVAGPLSFAAQPRLSPIRMFWEMEPWQM